jgi:hypothetical protein
VVRLLETGGLSEVVGRCYRLPSLGDGTGPRVAVPDFLADAGDLADPTPDRANFLLIVFLGFGLSSSLFGGLLCEPNVFSNSCLSFFLGTEAPEVAYPAIWPRWITADNTICTSPTSSACKGFLTGFGHPPQDGRISVQRPRSAACFIR